ncbi:MAG: HlyD family efflux transporter periplasmic adaptor subunit [Bacteroidales bacterium]|nr:HlyD family efflux transporter periplasmic adaptor subunit [Bacteroidales bacterium]
MKLKYFLIPLLLLLLAALYFLPFIHLPYNIRSQGIIYPEREWVLAKAGDGLLTYTLHDHFNQSVSYHAITEFQRGDHGEFVINNRIFHSERVRKNDTIGYLRSNEEQRLMMQLQGQLDVNRRQLEVYAAGERPEDVAIAKERVTLAEKEYETQQKLMERADQLFSEGVISPQDHELAQNEYQIKRMSLQIARSEYQAVQAGAKPEQLELVRAEIRALESQIDQVNARLSAFTIRAPFNGTIMREGPEMTGSENILRIADDSAYIVVLPVEVYQLAFIQSGQKVILRPENRDAHALATIAAIGNTVQLINRRQHVFITAVLDERPLHLLPRMLIQAEIETGKITLREYAARLSRTIYAN